MSPMSTHRSGVGVGVLNSLLYAVNFEEENQCEKNDHFPICLCFQVGGYDGASHQFLSSVECYSPQTDTWTPVREMVFICDFVFWIFNRDCVH